MALKYLQVGAIKQTKAGDKLYINLNKTKTKSGEYTMSNIVDLHKALGDFISNADSEDYKYGISLQIEKPQTKIARLCELGYIEESDAEKRLASVPEYIKYEVTYVKDA